ncbi:helix-turn-helix domain-containing protein [Clostridium combesii]|uniref:Rrf2 family transcriptional regulator n=1 Tax=Clostridium combesii TaxID=39481 RepID=UPI001FA84520|nr:Rrf2 family transcriptional regulator [Clostridium combesii]
MTLIFDETIIVTTRTIKKKISSRFSVVVYILSVLSMEDSNLCTSEWITDSVNINPVVIRRVMIM